MVYNFNDMWQVYVAIIAVVIILFVFIVALASRHNRGDYGDGGGSQIGGNDHIPFFAPANDRAGIWGERLVNHHLRPLLKADEYLIANLLLPLRNGFKTELDCVIVSHKGIFCIETKKWVGHISGNDEDEYWLQEYDDPSMEKQHRKNPVRQNEAHCAALRRILYGQYSIENIVIFADLEDGWNIESNHTYDIRGFKSFYRNLDDERLNPIQIEAVSQKLQQYVASPEELKRYRDEMNNRFY